MNRDVLEGKWKEMRGRVKETWGKLTDDDLDRINGKTEQLLGVLQEKYGYAREKAEEEIKRLMKSEDDMSFGAMKHKAT